ncbi:hydantoinase B/oxoprolinase family protein [Sinorhizobium meliloti]|uniref:5-oxoprolinase n=4 Tax=Rhizobium meliloti TaxID=382 RepID=A0AAW9TR57_RHIML|nr:hydantoinase B/oxoprolinase family protein [Sinorhizobium meliloti]ASQ07248.1 5-oxoprolinase [Sinorhizobium meliloti]MCK3786074.1 hydantoinase B/oxoprolinase family protein [Sinorhizobium meliloti]MCK3792357.1 hydantoinase B/oxoprolinase family protein [Sinorhizobium meliloti]MCK3798320.1 hydantoinase B/oxoprolinase family protein [Sinorhizobium meliloti]MCO6420244.1 hydantoinase B/oxoprolinase family protein [Sinorhizobium meliloti]
MLDKTANSLQRRLLESERLMDETGCYDGITELRLRRQDPLKFETLHTKLRAYCVSAREMARRISASPGVREVGEMVVAIYTPEGDAIALSNGIMVHVHTMSRFIKWMIRNGYEQNPCIRDGDIFANNDAFIGTVQVPDVMDVVPIFHKGTLVGWAGAVCHELEAGGITPGGDVCLAQERFTEGLFVCAEKIGENDEIRRDYVIRCERNLRMPIYWVLDEKAKVAACIDMRESVKQLIDEVGLEYWQRLSKEFIEEGRRAQLARTRQLTVPGIYRGHTFYGHVTEGKPGFQPLADPNWLYNIPIEMEITSEGKIRLDFDGTQPWGYHSMNCTPAGMDGGMFVTLTQHMNFEGLVNDGAWMATEINIPHGTWTNPDNEMAATATSWALLLPAYGVFQRLLSRGFIARGFVEEAFVGQVNSPMIEMGGTSQYGTGFGMAHFECAAAGSGALAIKDGLDTAYVGWNPESDMGNIEIWEQNMPMVYIGRSIVPNSGGAGKYRGGCAFISTWLINNTDHLRLVTSEHSSRVFDNGGLCGGYPAPTCEKHHAVRNSDIHERAERREPLAHTPGTDPLVSDFERTYKGEQVWEEGPYITRPHKAGDIFSHAYNGGGGFGDVLERDPIKTAWDVENGFLTREAAEKVFGIILKEDAEGYPQADIDATVARRAELRKKRLKQAIPVSEWIAREQRRVEASDFAPEVAKMYRSAMKLSPRFSRDFKEFWGLASDFAIAGEN